MAEAPPSLGEPLGFRPPEPPRREPLAGRHVLLQPLDAAGHGPDLYRASHGPEADPHLWDYLFNGPFANEAALIAWLRQIEDSTDPLFLTVVDRATGRAQGMVSFMRITPAHGVIEIGNIWFGQEIQRTPITTEAIYLLAAHTFETMGYRRLEWKCNSLNARSRAAALRLGFAYEGLFRQHMVVKDRSRDTTWYAMIDKDWPTIGKAFRDWLDPANLDAAGRQRRTLEAIRASIGP